MDLAKEVMARGNFDLRGWEYTGETESKEACTSVLVLKWNKVDTLALNSSLLEPQTYVRITKRTILSTAQRIFDPIGVASPVFLKPKLLLQKLWQSGINWDEEVPEDAKNEFNEW